MSTKTSTTKIPDPLAPTHLVPSLVDEAKAAKEAVEKSQEKPEDPRLAAMRESKTYTFDFDFQSESGKSYRGSFTNTVPSVRTLQAIGITRARLGGGLPFTALDPYTSEINLMVSHLQHSLSEENRPEWAEDLQALEDSDVLYALYEEVALHEGTFRQRGKPAKAGKG